MENTIANQECIGEERSRGQAASQLLPLVYDELRKLAAVRMLNEPGTQTLQPTALVHEVWLRLGHAGASSWDSPAHFFGAAAEAMRRILIERARRKEALKRGARFERIDLERVDLAVEADEESLLRVSEALEKLSLVDRQAAKVIRLRFFIGLEYEKAAEILGISVRSAKRSWTFGRAWLYRELSGPRQN